MMMRCHDHAKEVNFVDARAWHVQELRRVGAVLFTDQTCLQSGWIVSRVVEVNMSYKAQVCCGRKTRALGTIRRMSVWHIPAKPASIVYQCVVILLLTATSRLSNHPHAPKRVMTVVKKRFKKKSVADFASRHSYDVCLHSCLHLTSLFHHELAESCTPYISQKNKSCLPSNCCVQSMPYEWKPWDRRIHEQTLIRTCNTLQHSNVW